MFVVFVFTLEMFDDHHRQIFEKKTNENSSSSFVREMKTSDDSFVVIGNDGKDYVK